jgi:GH25 family lysozyme M1 (1,4-beta-N-acetylmuramidase)
MITGIDVSSYQGKIRWGAVAATKQVAFAFARAFHSLKPGDYGDDVTFAANHDSCTQAGIPFGAYCYFIVAQDGVKQAEHLLHVADGRFGTLAPVVDVEEGSGAQGWGTSVSGRIANLAACLQRITTAVAYPVIYTNQDTWNNYFDGTPEFAKYRLWIADPHSPAGHPKNMPRGWSMWSIHQYTTGSIAGIDGKVDLDCLNSENLKSIFGQ